MLLFVACCIAVAGSVPHCNALQRMWKLVVAVQGVWCFASNETQTGGPGPFLPGPVLNMAKTANLSVRIRPDLKGRIRDLKKSLDRSESWVVEKCLEQGLSALELEGINQLPRQQKRRS